MNPEYLAGFKRPHGHVFGLDRIGILESLEDFKQGSDMVQWTNMLSQTSHQIVEGADTHPTRTSLVCE